jgi:membrane-associated protease RseP (regulator of RpoE activity)
MENQHFGEIIAMREDVGPEPPLLVAEFAPVELTSDMLVTPSAARRRWLPLALFAATCVSTFYVGGWQYGAALMTILICHEMGHFLQACRYGVYASYPYFIPMPASPFGTFGAVIRMSSQMGDRRALFDIGISGPLAGLVPTLIFCVLGLHWSHAVPEVSGALRLGHPLLFDLLASWLCPPVPPGYQLELHGAAFAGFVGLFITALNLFPIGQLDGGHVLYALLRDKAHRVASVLLVAAVVTVVCNIQVYFGWLVMLFLLAMMGVRHPPTADDSVSLGTGRIILGWLTLAFLVVGFTPMPIALWN